MVGLVDHNHYGWHLCVLPSTQIRVGGHSYEGLHVMGYLYFQFRVFCGDQSRGLPGEFDIEAFQCEVVDPAYKNI